MRQFVSEGISKAHTKQQPLFTLVRIGKLELPNRIVMAPLTRIGEIKNLKNPRKGR
jgi:2,4-dienoyl-CoA reductase-like NADH-dependent reductase (Old Yellow Enzyme family)